ncbi:Osmotin, thaumatin-like protein [Hortaea werneckii]|nr:Osmotin, thaumatin-like protein [Hortaea werneckii]KAI7486771.1 Osmotin, thaumatin-like protein [Hortaea werneckii]
MLESVLLALVATAWILPCATAGSRDINHHMNKFRIAKRQHGNASTPLVMSNWCSDTIWPAVDSQGGTGPENTGFELASGENQTEYVSSDWQGRVWGRTNCTFSGHGGGVACTTGDCGGIEACQGPGAPPATLAEFTLNGGQQQTFYDLSLVDGYNLPMAIVMMPNGHSSLESIDQSTSNPSCVASIGNLAAPNFNPYTNNQQFLGTTAHNALPFENGETASSISQWCPWDLQVTAPSKPGNGAYPYPDGNVDRPAFDPCYSACAKYNEEKYCCSGAFDDPGKCTANYYADAAKTVCPDAYSYAYDDQDSTFVQPTGAGFQIIFCPGGRSTTIIASKGTSAIEHGDDGGSSDGQDGSNAAAPRLLIDWTSVPVQLFGVALLVVVFF